MSSADKEKGNNPDLPSRQRERIASLLRYLYGMTFRIFYLFFPYGSRRWFILKTILRVVSRPGFYFKMLNSGVLTGYLHVVFHNDLVKYDREVSRTTTPAADLPGSPGFPEIPVTSAGPEIPVGEITSDQPGEPASPEVLFLFTDVKDQQALRRSAEKASPPEGYISKTMILLEKGKNPEDLGGEYACADAAFLDAALSADRNIRYVALMEEGCLPTPDTILNCISSLESSPRMAMAVPKSLYSPAELADAGIIIWDDGSATAYGNLGDPAFPDYNFLREVDSGSRFVLVKAGIFRQWIAGRAVTEENPPRPVLDLSMFIRELGMKVVYDPRAEVFIENNAGPRLTAAEPPAAFYDKWRRQLHSQHLKNLPGNLFRARERGQGRNYMLIVDHYVPTFDKDAGSRTMKAYMDLFRDKGFILKFIGNYFYPDEKYVRIYQEEGIEVLYGKYYEDHWDGWVMENGRHFSHVFLSRPTIAIKYIGFIREHSRAKIMFYGHDLHHLREMRQYEIEKDEEMLRKAVASKEMERQLFLASDYVYYPSMAEIDIIRKDFQIRNTARAIVPYFFEPDPVRKPYHAAERKDLLFIGGFYHQPNCDAIIWFIDTVFPMILSEIPGVRLIVAGSNPTDEIRAKSSEHIMVTGYVSDSELAGLYSSCRMVVAPLRYGAGLKGKIVEALYYGIPVVTTPVGAEGLDGCGDFLTVTRTAGEFAGAVISLYNDTATLDEYSVLSYRYVLENFSREKALSVIEKDLEPGYIPRFRMKPAGKILFISHDAHLGGAQLLLLSVLRWFRDHTSYDIRVVCNQGGVLYGRFSELAPTLVFGEMLQKYRDTDDLTAALLGFCEGRPDLVYGNTVAAGKHYRTVSRLGAPVLTHVHEMKMSIEYYASGFMKDVVNLSRGFIAASGAVADNLLSSYTIGRDVVSVVHAFIDEIRVPPLPDKDKKAVREKLGLRTDGFLVFGCGVGLFWRKGGDLFISLARILREKGLEDFHFYWIGTFDETEKRSDYGLWSDHLESIKKNGLERQVSFLGHQDDVREFFRAGDVFVLTSREDPFPLVALEAAQCGLPVICFEKAGGMPEFVGRDAGFSLPFGDLESMAEKILLLAQNPSLKLSLGETAKEKVNTSFTSTSRIPGILSACRKTAGLKPAVSIVVPNYNYGRYLGERLKSITEQTFRDYELIILDDASSDDSVRIIEQFCLNHDALTVFNPVNSGSVFRQWFRGISMASADIVWMAEADDLAEPGFLELMLPLLHDPGVNIAFCSSKVMDEEGQVTENYYRDTGWYARLPGGDKWNGNYVNTGVRELNDALAVKNVIPNASAVLFRKSSLQQIDTDALFSYRCGGDWYIYINSLRKGSIAYNCSPLNYHRRHGGSVVGRSVNSAAETIPDYFRIHKFAIEHFPLDEQTFLLQQDFIQNNLRRIWPSLEDREFRELYDAAELRKIYRRK